MNLETHVCDITGLITAEELQNAILCGHSAAGSVITVAADRLPERIAGLCYLDASMPLDGQSLLDFIGDSQGVPAVFREQAQKYGDGWRIPAGVPFDAGGFGVADPADAAWVNRQMSAHPLAAFEDRLDLSGAWETIQMRHYIRCEKFKIAHGEPLIQRLEVDPTWQTERWDCGHSPHITEPERVIEALQGMATSFSEEN